MKRLLREPLLHFLVLGGLVFAAYRVLNPQQTAGQNEIVVTAGQVENLAATFAKVWQRPPSAEELKAQVDQYVNEEMLSREAMALGLDKNDTVIRRRLQQKMEFIAEDFAAASEPTEAELADYLAKHTEQFAAEPRLSFRQVYLSPDRQGNRLEAVTTRLLAELKSQGGNAEIADKGDSTLLPRDLVQESLRGVAAHFGSDFATDVSRLKPGEWTGPIASAYGVHLVLLTERIDGRVPALDEVREQVKREVMNERRLLAQRKFQEQLLTKYRVEIQWPKNESVPNSQTASVKP